MSGIVRRWRTGDDDVPQPGSGPNPPTGVARRGTTTCPLPAGEGLGHAEQEGGADGRRWPSRWRRPSRGRRWRRCTAGQCSGRAPARSSWARRRRALACCSRSVVTSSGHEPGHGRVEERLARRPEKPGQPHPRPTARGEPLSSKTASSPLTRQNGARSAPSIDRPTRDPIGHHPPPSRSRATSGTVLAARDIPTTAAAPALRPTPRTVSATGTRWPSRAREAVYAGEKQPEVPLAQHARPGPDHHPVILWRSQGAAWRTV